MIANQFLPPFKVVSEGLGCISFELSFPENHELFAGHFPEQPILPGVGQLYVAEALAKQYLNIKGDFQRLEAIKFKNILQPKECIVLKLNYNIDKNKLVFQFFKNEQECSSGRMVYAL